MGKTQSLAVILLVDVAVWVDPSHVLASPVVSTNSVHSPKYCVPDVKSIVVRCKLGRASLGGDKLPEYPPRFVSGSLSTVGCVRELLVHCTVFESRLDSFLFPCTQLTGP